MKKAKWFLLLLASCFSYAHAMPGTFDRSAEIAHYIEQLNSDLSHEELIAVAKPIYVSGIMDDKLAQAIGDRLLKDVGALEKADRASSQYAAWMLKALGSTGTELAGNLIKETCTKTKTQRIQQECADQLHELPWQRRKNEIMSSRENYSEGDDMRVAQLLNLLKSDDFSYKQDAAYRMSWDKILDARLMQEIAKQLQVYIDKNGVSKDKAEIVVMSHYVKMLGYSGNEQYLPMLEIVVHSKAEQMVKGQAKTAIKRLNKKAST